MELCLPVPPQRARCGPTQPGTGNTCECADARGMFSLRVALCASVTWNVVGTGGCLPMKRQGGSVRRTNAYAHTHVQSGNPTVTPSF